MGVYYRYWLIFCCIVGSFAKASTANQVRLKAIEYKNCYDRFQPECGMITINFLHQPTIAKTVTRADDSLGNAMTTTSFFISCVIPSEYENIVNQTIKEKENRYTCVIKAVNHEDVQGIYVTFSYDKDVIDVQMQESDLIQTEQKLCTIYCYDKKILDSLMKNVNQPILRII